MNCDHRSNRNTKFSARLLGMVALAIFAASPSSLLAKDNELLVTCVDPSGNPIRDVQVFAMGLGDQKTEDKKTNQRGLAEFKKLDDGVYRVWARQEGYAPVLMEFIRLANAEKQSIQLEFEAGSPEQKLYFEDQALQARANQLLQEGTQLLQAQQFAEAEKKLQESVQIYPSNVESTHNLAVAYLQQQKMDQAQQQFEKEIELLEVYKVFNPQHEAALQAQADQVQQIVDSFPLFKLETEMNAAMQQQNYEVAIQKLEQMFEMQPSQDALPHLLYNLALAQAHSDQLEQAEASIDKALGMRPDEVSFQSLKRQVQERLQLADLNQFKLAVGRVDETFQQGNYSAALERYQELMAQAPDEFKPHLLAQIARTHKELNQPEEAVTSYRQAIELDPENPSYRQGLAQLYFERKEYDAFVETYVGALERDKSASVPDGLYKISQDLMRRGQKELAGNVFKRIIEIDPNYSEAYYDLGMHYFYVEQKPAEAKTNLQKYMKMGKDQDHLGNAKAVLTVIDRPKK